LNPGEKYRIIKLIFKEKKMITAEQIVKELNLRPHPMEGGYFVETYRSPETVVDEVRGKRSASTAIYFLITGEAFSEMHVLTVDEVYHFYLGDPVEMLTLHPDGRGGRLLLGNDPTRGMRPQVVVPQGVWQGSRVRPGGKYNFALIGTTVAPGFEYPDYTSGGRGDLTARYPEFKDLISVLTRKP
jgi:predicted cupin superfamily sugar epimerase